MYRKLKEPDSPIESLKPDFAWAEWPERWRQASDGITRLGLIHGVFDTYTRTPQEVDERIRYILELTCEYTKPFHDRVIQRQIWEASINVVTRRFFSPNKGAAEIYKLSPAVIEAIFWFFENTFHIKDNVWKTRAIDGVSEHVSRELKWFFNNLWRVIWEDTYKDGKHAKFKPTIIHFMAEMGTLSLLMPNAKGVGNEGSWLRFDQASVDVLEELALKEAGKVLNVESAVRRGSQAAVLLLAIRAANPLYVK